MKKEEYVISDRLKNFTIDDCKPLANQLVAEKTMTRLLNEKLTSYKLKPEELGARLSEWIFLIIKGHSIESIKSAEQGIFGKRYYQDISQQFSDASTLYIQARKEFDENRRKLHILREQNRMKEFADLSIQNKELEKKILDSHKRKKSLQIALVYLSHMEKEAARVAKLFRKRYAEAVDLI